MQDKTLRHSVPSQIPIASQCQQAETSRACSKYCQSYIDSTDMWVNVWGSFGLSLRRFLLAIPEFFRVRGVFPQLIPHHTISNKYDFSVAKALRSFHTSAPFPKLWALPDSMHLQHQSGSHPSTWCSNGKESLDTAANTAKTLSLHLPKLSKNRWMAHWR